MLPNDSPVLTRRSALQFAGLSLAGLALAPWLSAHAQVHEREAAALTAEDALQLLLEGNQRWATDRSTQPNRGLARRAEVASGQHPFAVVVSCVDSRVPPELVFDRGLGDLLVVRTAGHVVDDATLGSIEYGVEELHIPLVVVLGHQSCGAVIAAIEAVTHQVAVPGRIASLVEGIRPAVERTMGQAGDVVDNTVRANTVITVEQLRVADPILTELGAHGALLIVGARYDLTTGLIEIIA